MKSTHADAAITLFGPPRNAVAIMRLDSPGKSVIPVRMKLAGETTICRAHVRPLGHGTSEIRLRLPAETPPGRYNGVGTISGRDEAIVVEVEPVLRLNIRPRQTSIAVEAGSKTDFTITVVNGGNVPVDVPKAVTFDIDDADGQDRALGRALRATLAEGERRVDRLFEEIRAEHGGEAGVRVRDGAGLLAQGETRTLRCVLEVPSTALAGRSYLGAWPLGNASHVILIEVTKGASHNSGRTIR